MYESQLNVGFKYYFLIVDFDIICYSYNLNCKVGNLV